MAKREGFEFIETLTGFKWMGNKAYDLLKLSGNHVIFAYEEAIGFMCGSAVLDKDGVSAAFQLATFASFLHSQNEPLTLTQKLEEIYQTYGYHCSCNSYFICHDSDLIQRIFDRIRKYNSQSKIAVNIFTYFIRSF